MLEFLGIADTEALFDDIPEQLRMKRALQLRPAMSELELERHLGKLAQRNQDAGQVVSYLGAGSYEHYQPSVVDAIISRSEFYTSYTPYQPEVSQGMLQAIFEYQTMVSELTGMDIANASMYDGPTAFAEAGIVCCAHTRRDKLVVAGSVHPEYRAVLDTYARGQSIEVVALPSVAGVVDSAALAQVLDGSVAGVLIQYPNFFGRVEDVRAIADATHAVGAVLVVSTYPIALGLLETPGALGADLVVAEGQSLGNPMAYGGPYLGIMAAKRDLMRRLPGRIVGQTSDHDGRRGFVLTLQAREQHIRREKASSNICSNQALNALAATVYMSYMGPNGMKEVALQNFHKAHYLYNALKALPGVKIPFDGPFFNEFVVQLPKSAAEVQDQLLQDGILFGLNLGTFYPDLENCVLISVTEVRSREELDETVRRLGELL
ncbi:glycine dehydrogenase [Alicyclobacillus ferrooxydans]|uniref:Probable glycine dehydrogenase (decarboxylating) subunit 1 n=2 Tax=Alicyclobacillus ferrooxydans TaxID=471514 RepID=A0A0P9D1C3_9BACL|nr:glycine dehydrogenase [Alicyclobacillus ferrooxydans]